MDFEKYKLCNFNFPFTPKSRRWFRAANHCNCICYCCIFLLQSWFQHFLMAQGITFYWPTKKHPEMHFHLPPIDLSQAWQSFKIKHFTVCKNNPKHKRKNCFVHTWMRQKHLKNPKTTGQTLYFKLNTWSLIPEASNPFDGWVKGWKTCLRL